MLLVMVVVVVVVAAVFVFGEERSAAFMEATMAMTWRSTLALSLRVVSYVSPLSCPLSWPF